MADANRFAPTNNPLTTQYNNTVGKVNSKNNSSNNTNALVSESKTTGKKSTEPTIIRKSWLRKLIDSTKVKEGVSHEEFLQHGQTANEQGAKAIPGAAKGWAGSMLDYTNTISNAAEEKWGNPYADIDISEEAEKPKSIFSRPNMSRDEFEARQYKATRENALKTADKLAEESATDLATAKASGGENNKIMNVATDLVTNATQMGLDAITGVPQFAMFLRSAGASAREAKEAGATTNQQLLYGTTKGAIELATEKLTDGLAGLYGKGVADDLVEDIVGRLAKTDNGRTVIRGIAGALGEGGEEAVSDILDPFAKLIYDTDMRNKMKNGEQIYDPAEIGYDFLIGTAMGALGSGVNVLNGTDASKNAALRTDETATEIKTLNRDNRVTTEDGYAAYFTKDGVNTNINIIGPDGNMNRYPVKNGEATETGLLVKETASHINELRADAENGTKTAVGEQNTSTQQITQPTTENATQTVEPSQNATQNTANTQLTQTAPISNAENGRTAYDNMNNIPSETNERGMSENVRTDESMHPEIRAKYENDPLMYEVAHNKDTLGKALNIIEQGVPQATQYIETRLSDAKNGKKLNPEDVPLARMIANELYDKASKTDDQIGLDRQRADKILNDIAEELTWAGQFGQAAAILRNADPNMQLRNMQKAVDILNEKYAKQNAKNGTEIAIPQELIDKYKEADTSKGRDAVIEEMQMAVANQCGHTIGGMFTALRYLNMLGNFKTQARNLIGNSGMLVERNIKDTIGALMESVVNPKERTKSVVRGSFLLQTPEYKAALAEFKADPSLQSTAMGEAKYSDGSSANSLVNAIESKKKPFSEKGLIGKTLGKGLNAYHNVTSWAMEMGDQIFVAENYAEALAGYMRANGISTEQWQSMVESNDPFVTKARNYAIKQAQESTFRDTNAVSKAVSQFDKNWSKAGKVFTQGLQPFRKTPANVMVRMEEYSPLGLVNTVVKGIQAEKGKNNVTGADVIDSLAKTLTGSGLTMLGFALANAGKAKTKSADEEQENFDKLNGIQDYSITIGDTNITIDWLTPEATALFMGVALGELQKDGLNGDTAFKILGQLTDPMLEMSMMSGISDTLNQLSNADDINTIGQLVLNSMLNYLGQGITNTMFGQLEQGSEDYRQTYYIDKDSMLPSTFQKWLAKAGNKTPGVDFQAADYIDAWGEKQEGQGYANALLNPAYVANVKGDKLTTELNKLYDSLKGTEFEGSVFPQQTSRNTIVDDTKLNNEEYDKYAVARGQKSKELVSEFVNSSEYAMLDDFTKGEIIKELYSKATDYAKDLIQQERGTERNSDYYALTNEIEKKGDNKTPLDAKNLVAYTTIKTTTDNALKNEDFNTVDSMVDMYKKADANIQKVLSEKMPEIKPYLEASDVGVNAENWNKVKTALSDIQWAEDTQSDGSRLKFKAVVDADIPEADKKKLLKMDGYLSKNWAMAYDVLSKYGFKNEGIYDFFNNADWTLSQKTGEYEANGQLGAYEAYVALQRLPISDAEKKSIFNDFVSATGEPGRYDGWSRNTAKGKWAKYTYDYIKGVDARYGIGDSYGRNNVSNTILQSANRFAPTVNLTPNNNLMASANRFAPQ